MTETVVAKKREVPEYPALTAKDLCDRDTGVQAYVRMVHERTGADLLLCKHHFEKHEDALILQGFVVAQDARPGLYDDSKPAG